MISFQERNVIMPKISKEELIELQKSLITDIAIARHLGIRHPAVQYARKVHKIPSRYSGNSDRNKEIVALYSNGLTAPDIAGRFGLSACMVYQIAHEAGVGKNKIIQKSPSKHYDQILELYGKGIPGTAIAHQIGKSLKYVCRIISSAGVDTRWLPYVV